MIIDNFVEAAKTFLSCFNLKLENKKTNILSSELLSNNPINVLDYNNNAVGNIYIDDIYYRINIILEDKIISGLVYKNEKEKSTFNFKYSINNIDGYKTLLKGFYTSRKNNKGKIIYSNEYRIPGTGFVKKECTFDSLTNSYEIKDNRYDYSCNLSKNTFIFKTPIYNLVIKKYPNNIYSEKIYKTTIDNDDIYLYELLEKDNGTDSFMGYEVDWNATTFAKEIDKIVEYLAPEYYVFINKFKLSSDDIYNDLFYNTVNKTIKDSDERKLFKIRNIIKKEENGVKRKNRKKRRNR